MIAATPDSVDLVLTVSPVILAVVGAAILLWITLLTVFVLRRCREPWRDDGRPVYQRLPDGRIRFSWGVAAKLAAAQRRSVADHDELDTYSIGRRTAVTGATEPIPFHDSRGRTS